MTTMSRTAEPDSVRSLPAIPREGEVEWGTARFCLNALAGATGSDRARCRCCSGPRGWTGGRGRSIASCARGACGSCKSSRGSSPPTSPQRSRPLGRTAFRGAVRRCPAQEDVDHGTRPGVTSAGSAEVKRTKAENEQLCEDQETLRPASVLFAASSTRATSDPRVRRREERRGLCGAAGPVSQPAPSSMPSSKTGAAIQPRR